MPSDRQAIQGYWRFVSLVSEGDEVGTGMTHVQFDGDRVKEIWPSLLDGGEWQTFELNPRTRPKRMTVTSRRRRGRRTVDVVEYWLYELDGDELRICTPNVFGELPDEFSDKTHSVMTLKRHKGPPPATKQPSGKKPVLDAVLGRLKWNDNRDTWEGRLALTPDRRVGVTIDPEGGDDAAVIAKARDVVRWLRKSEPAARRFAAGELLDTHNDAWNEGPAISARAFAGRMRLESVSVRPGGSAELYYDDGDLFWGHTIIVSVSAERKFTDAEMAG